MNRPDARALIETLAARAHQQAGAGGGKPDPDELVAYLRGELAAEDEARLARRLVADPASARALLDLAELEEAASAADESHLPDPQTRAGWRDLEARLPGAPQAPRSGWFPAWLSPALLALLLVATAALAVRVVQLEERLLAPRALVAVELSLTERGGEKEAPAGRPLALWLPLDLDPAAPCTDLVAEIAGPGDGRWRLHPAADDQGWVTLSLPPAAPGLYEVTVSGCGRSFGAAHLRLVAAAAEGGADG